MRIGYFGRSGSNTEHAARAMYGGTFSGYASIADIFGAVSDGSADRGVVPIENSVEGSVGIVNDMLYREDLDIVKEFYMKITHCLVVRPGTDTGSIRTVISHPQALGQCSAYIARHGYETIPFPDTATSVAALREDRYAGYAAIASREAAEMYGMEIAESDIGDFQDNYTRFVALAVKPWEPDPEKKMKASIVVSLDHRPGSLKRILDIFSEGNVNLTRIESRPVKFAPWNYIFFLDAEYGTGDSGVLDRVRESSSSFKLLGIYPMARL